MTSAITPGDGFPNFPAGFRGQVLRPGEHGYDEARAVNNGRAADEGPALIARCLDEDDVATVLRYASATGTPVAVRGGGHGYDGHAMPGGALVVDLSALRSIVVDSVERTVRAQAGVTLGDLDAATQKYGLVVPSGTVTSTGIAGLALGGGITASAVAGSPVRCHHRGCRRGRHGLPTRRRGLDLAGCRPLGLS
ncbi:FAD-dependent oxidoreductase [Streptomyces sp. NPDC097640]|uniref:FAD-binding oxidoreductase n=1 Tax=Streptomyces sp. NPDC097640 TaxID=3157229 RepID=UPI003324B751